MVPGDCVRDRSGCARSWEVLGACALAACWLDEQAPAHTLLDDFEAVDRFCGIASAWERADERCRRLLAAALTGSFARRLVIVRGEERDKEARRGSRPGSLEEPRFVGVGCSIWGRPPRGPPFLGRPPRPVSPQSRRSSPAPVSTALSWTPRAHTGSRAALWRAAVR